ncbi:MAG: tetratricopeptide repeat protein, partial [Dehalococcoidia bacterium]
VLGTVPYMSPEQARGDNVDFRSDQFALGSILYELATGKLPFQRESVPQTMSAIIEDEPEPLAKLNTAVPARLSDIVQRCLKKDPVDRFDSTAALANELNTVERRSPVERRRRNLLFAVAGALGALGVLWLIPNAGRLVGSTPATVQSIAVLPLQNLSGDPDEEYFADGMTDALTADLARFPALKVISRTSTMRYKASDKPIPQIAEELNVDAVVEGSVLRSGQGVRITAQLIDAPTDTSLWANSYERNLRDVLLLQSEIARAIAGEIEVILTPEEAARLSTERAVDPETYQAYLRGMFYLHQSTPEGLQKGLRQFHEAVESDPADPFANAGLALGYAIRGHAPGTNPRESFPRAKAAALRALALDDGLADAHLALGDVYLYYEWDWPAAERELRRALSLNPNSAEAHYHYGWYLDLMGRRDEALEELQRAQEIDPLSPLFTSMVGAYYWATGREERAIEEARKSLELNPNFPFGHVVLGRAYSQTGRHEEAIATQQTAADIAAPFRAELAIAYALAGRGDEARTIATEIEDRENPGDAFTLAELYAALGEKDEAFRHLNAAYDYRVSFLPWLEYSPNMEVLRGDPRYDELLRRLNLKPVN